VTAPSAGDAAPPARGEAEGHRGVAVLLGIVAILAALTGARATSLASDATDLWQSSLRTELKRSVGALEDVRYLYQVEVPAALPVLSYRLQSQELRTAAATASGQAAAALALEADVADNIVTSIESSNELATKDAYARDDGSLDLGRRLSDLRMRSPDLVALDPDAIQAEGDHLGTKASSMTLALLPLAIAALFGAIAQPFGRARGLLLGLGSASAVIGAGVAILVEVLG
jgi:hypothetical protein